MVDIVLLYKQKRGQNHGSGTKTFA